jgi:hypothetical protein
MPYNHVAVFPVLPLSPRLRANGETRKVVTQRKEDTGCHICSIHVMVGLPSLDSVYYKETMYFFMEEDYDWYLSI